MMFAPRYCVYIWTEDGWVRYWDRSIYPNPEDAIAQAKELAFDFPEDRYCVASDRRIVFEIGPKTSFEDVYQHWRSQPHDFATSCRTIANDLEFGVDAVMLEAAEMLRVMAHEWESVRELKTDE